MNLEIPKLHSDTLALRAELYRESHRSREDERTGGDFSLSLSRMSAVLQRGWNRTERNGTGIGERPPLRFAKGKENDDGDVAAAGGCGAPGAM